MAVRQSFARSECADVRQPGAGWIFLNGTQDINTVLKLDRYYPSSLLPDCSRDDGNAAYGNAILD